MSKVNQTEAALALLNVVKGLDPAALRDVERIAAVTDGHGRDGIPNKTEVPTSPALPMRGGAAAPTAAANGDFQRQDGVAWDYELMSRRMDQMEKSNSTIANILMAMKKASESPARFEHEKDTTKDVAKALRKSRMAVRKAESAEDEEEIAEATEKADTALKACDAEIEKAEEEVESEEEEKFVEKALNELTALRKSFRATKAARVKKAEDEEEARKAAAIKAEEEEAARKAAEIAAKAECTDAEKMEKAATVFESLGMGDFFASFQKSMTAQTQVASAPDFFSKAQAQTVPFATRLRNAGLEAGEEGQAESLNVRLELVKANKLPQSAFEAALAAAPENVRTLFTA